MHIAAAEAVNARLLPAMRSSGRRRSRERRDEFDDIVKIGRTHLQDAVPMRMGQEFSGYARQVAASIERVRGGAAPAFTNCRWAARRSAPD